MNTDLNAPPAAKASENCLPIGTRLSDFEITGVLGEGGFGIVYLAFDHALQRTVAIKEYMPGVLAARAPDHSVSVRSDRNVETFNIGLKSFINEARFLAQFDHPSLVKVYRYWEENRTAYTAMKYYEGRTVKDIVVHSGELVTETWCRSVIRQILDALELLDTMNIVHRDVSPDNIIVQDNGEAVLLDFGSARQILGDAARGLTVILKPGYAPVEQYAGDASLEQGPFTDIYALCAVMYFAIVGEPPATSIARMVKDPLVPLLQRAPEGFSGEFLAAIDGGLAVMAADRPQSIDDFRALLGIQEPSSPRPKAPGAARFATVDRIEGGMSYTGSTVTMTTVGATAIVTGEADTAGAPAQHTPETPASPSSAAIDDLVTIMPEPAPARAHAPRIRVRPRWLTPVAASAALVALIGVSSALLIGDSDEVMRPITPAPAVQVAAAPASTPAAPLGPAAIVTEPVPATVPAAAPLPAATPVASAVTAPAVAPPAPVGASPAASPAWVLETVEPETLEPASADPSKPAADSATDTKPAQAPLPTATYELAIRPWGIVYVNGKKHGASPPLKDLKLTVGKHKIKVVNRGFPDYVTTVTAKANGGGTISHNFAASSQF